VSYDLADDSIWGLGLGCSGAVDILIEQLEDDTITREWVTMLERAEPAVLVTSLSGVSGRMIVSGAGLIAGGLSDAVVEQQVVDRARDRLHAPYPASGPVSIGSAEVFLEITTPPPDLVIFGAGPDAAPVARMAWTHGVTPRRLQIPNSRWNTLCHNPYRYQKYFHHSAAPCC
jgi:xanthine dehydrogenase accessory factor